MQITFVQGILLTILAMICAVDAATEAFFWFRPIVVAFFAGIILGDVQLGLAAGAVAELSYLGLLTVGGTVPPDPLMAGMMTTVIAYTSNVSAETALGLALPFALLAQWWGIFTNTSYAGFMKPLEDKARNADIKGFWNVIVIALAIKAIGYGLITFLSTYAMQSVISTFVNSFPVWLIHGFEIAGGILPAVGLGLLLRIMLKGENAPYLFLGFLMATFLSLGNVLPIAIAAIAIAIIGYYNDKRIAGNGGTDHDGI
ncbi:MAG: PTS sugar transporter subunit IIC [Erysipelotrichaceae bacterium]|nr:PTS sugar transporter subunit IIC [Erysipelotrichaceae bacterium]